MPSHNRAGVQHGVAANFHKIPQNRAEFFPARLYGGIGFHRHRRLVAFDVAGNAPGPHMGTVAQNAVAHIVVMRRLHPVKENHVFQFHGVAHHAVCAHQRGTPDKRAVAHFRLRTDDARPVQGRGGGDDGAPMRPDGGEPFYILLSQRGSQREKKRPQSVQRLPGIAELSQKVPRQGVGQVKKRLYRDKLCHCPLVPSFSMDSPDDFPGISSRT